MKKVTSILTALLACGVIVQAGAISQQITERQLRDPKQLRPLINDNFAEIDDRTELMLQKADVVAGTNATETITFAVAFGAAPTVVLTYTEDPGDVRLAFVTSVTASNFLAHITADKNYGYVAVGTRP